MARNAATSVDEGGKRFWSDAGKRRVGYAVSAAINLALLYVVSGELVWDIPYLTSAFVAPLAVIQLSLTATLVANLAFLAYDAGWFLHTARIGLNVLAFAATYSLLAVFPFELPTEFWGEAVRLALIVALVGIAIASVAELVRMIVG